MAEVVIKPADGPREVASDLIDEHHEHLQEARILWLFTSSKRSKGNRVVLGTTNRTTALTRYLTARAARLEEKGGRTAVAAQQPADFIVQIEEKRWNTMLQTQRLAFIDSLLCRMQRRETVNQRSGQITKTWTTVAPDVEEFSQVILRHGVWLPEHQAFARAMQEHGGGARQLTLELPDPRVDKEPEAPESEPERVTTVDESGLVVATEVVSDKPVTEADLEAQLEEDADIPAILQTDLATENALDDIEEDRREVVEPQDDEALAQQGWQERTGISQLEVRRARRRGTVSSEQAPVPA